MTKRQTVTLFTRKGCHLCEKAKEVIKDLQGLIDFNFEELNIEEKDEWTENFGLKIPVVMINGNEVQYGQIDKITISKALSQ
ncbi:glutaredoxin family protein [Niallia sp. Krafla_26]|uniref:glutaredoxin family protein n=1 Tax=Niallia sp. Krafla_26 TaxID=3064703 RepID=UPI003D184E18